MVETITPADLGGLARGPYATQPWNQVVWPPPPGAATSAHRVGSDLGDGVAVGRPCGGADLRCGRANAVERLSG